MRYSHISIAVPMLAETENLPPLFEALKRQTFKYFHLYCCVNNPEGWAESAVGERRAQWQDNQTTLKWLQDAAKQGLPFGISILDRSSTGNGWHGKQHGVGWARKTLLEAILADRGDDELVVSLDADTGLDGNYMESAINAMNGHPHHSALAMPYYHPLTGKKEQDRSLLRYETYMRHYLINLLEIKSWLQQQNIGVDLPYAFTALGSAMVFPLWAYKRVGGFTPLQGGEDFYLMQKFAKTGTLLLDSGSTVYPQGRPSRRVPFGTGPAIAQGIDSTGSTYPFYPQEGFEAVRETYSLFPDLYDTDKDTPMTSFLCKQLKVDNPWQPLRKNFRTRALFIHACQERVDGLRILQFLKTLPRRNGEEELETFCKSHGINIPNCFSFQNSPLSEVTALREVLFQLEMSLRRQCDRIIYA